MPRRLTPSTFLKKLPCPRGSDPGGPFSRHTHRAVVAVLIDAFAAATGGDFVSRKCM